MTPSALLANSAATLSRADRASLVDLILEHYPGHSREFLDAVVQLLAGALSKPRPKPVHGSTTDVRTRQLVELLNSNPTVTLAHAARVMGISLARVNQLVKKAREEGAELPSRQRGRPSQASNELCMKVLPLLTAGRTYMEVRTALGIKTAGKMRTVVRTLREMGESLPDPDEVIEWREELDDVARRGREVYGAYLKTPTPQLKQELAELRALHAAIAQQMPEHVTSAPAI